AEATRQTMSFEHLGTYGKHDTLDAVILAGLPRHRRERLLDRQAGAYQGSQLASDQCQLGTIEATTRRQPGKDSFLLARFFGTGLIHFKWHPALVTQLLAHLARTVCFEHALADLATVIK